MLYKKTILKTVFFKLTLSSLNHISQADDNNRHNVIKHNINYSFLDFGKYLAQIMIIESFVPIIKLPLAQNTTFKNNQLYLISDQN